MGQPERPGPGLHGPDGPEASESRMMFRRKLATI